MESNFAFILGGCPEWVRFLSFVDVTFSEFAKGQLISKCPFDAIVWTKIPTKKIPGFLP